jgi:hypothetical protein
MARSKRTNLTGQVGQVDDAAPMDGPKVRLADGALGAKVVGDSVGLPLHLLGPIIGADGRPAPNHQPSAAAAP